MPIIVKDFHWEDSDDNVYITVPLKGVKSHKVNILSTNEYIKVSYPPYIFECFLFSSVYDQKGNVEIGNGIVLFKLRKEEPGLWPQLEDPNKDDKTWQREKREEALTKIQERSEEEKKVKKEVKRELDKYGVKEQMKLEESDQQRIETLKQKERTQATEELERWKDHQKLLTQQDKQKKEEEERIKLMNEKNKSASLFDEDEEEEENFVPVRQTGKIEVSFTDREFPTPLRESIKPEEDEWLKKQADARRIAEIHDKDLTEEERNPQWLKDKGDSFFKAGNFLAAINAYSHAIRLSCQMPSLYSNRAACHLKLGNMFKCAEDCSKALDLLTPPVPQNATSRMKAHIRRGTAYCHLEAYVEGLMDYEAALKIDPNNEQLKADADKVRVIIQSSTG